MNKPVKQIVSGAVVFICGMLVSFAVMGVMIFTAVTAKPVKQFLAPATTSIEVAEAGKYYLWNDYQTIFEGKSYSRSTDLPDGVTISLVSKADSQKIDFTTAANISQSSGSSSKNSIGHFEITTPGEYTLSVQGTFEPRVFSVGKSFFSFFVPIFLIGGIGISVLCGAGVILAFLGIKNLTQSKTKQNDSI